MLFSTILFFYQSYQKKMSIFNLLSNFDKYIINPIKILVILSTYQNFGIAKFGKVYFRYNLNNPKVLK